MHCRSCGADLPADAAYCSQCGARVDLGSVLGVGTDLPPIPSREQHRATPTEEAEVSSDAAPEAGPVQAPAAEEKTPAPVAAPAQDLSETRELPRIDPAVPAPAQPPAPAEPPAPARPVPAVRASAPASAPVDHEPEHSRSSILAMVATFAVLTIIGTFALTRLLGSDDPEPVAESTPTSSVEESGDVAPAPSTSAPAPSETPSAEPSPSASTSVPAEARRCSTSGNDAVATAYAGTERTSCEFAASVRDAYRKAGTPSGATSLRAYSPVTKKWYSLSCDGGEPVRCTSTTNAIVILTP